MVNNLETSPYDDAGVIIYDCHMFIVQATGVEHVQVLQLGLGFWQVLGKP
jgi:hypothetical protein